ncbi:MAG: ATP-binding cassette domain-containing protein, partial [Actinomycetes bacterium]
MTTGQPPADDPTTQAPAATATGHTGADDASTRDRGEHERGAANSLLRTDNVIAGYVPGVNILNGCDFYVNDGELVGIIGPNGAGKSTLLKAIFGLIKVSEGSVTLRVENITG